MTNLKFQREREQKGITLIALVVTIIVLIILAGVSINMLVGENGIITQSQRAEEDYSKSEVKEKVELALNEYMIEKSTEGDSNFANFLRKTLQVGVAENEDNTYSFMLGEWQVVTDENKVISIEKFKLDVDKTYPNVASMKADTGLTDGQLVQTEGYWDKQYAGGAYYDIVSSTSLTVDDTKCIQLDNGLYAELHVINDTVTVNQFGAYGDGEHDDAENIQLALNAGYGNVSFETGNYIINNTININNKICVIGKDTVNIYSDSSESVKKIFVFNESTIVMNLSFESINDRDYNAGEGLTSNVVGINLLASNSSVDNIHGKNMACIVDVGNDIGQFTINNIDISNCIGENITFGIQFSFVDNIKIHDCSFSMSELNSQLPHTIYTWGGSDNVEIYNIYSECSKSITSLFRFRDSASEFPSENGSFYVHDCTFNFLNGASGEGIELIGTFKTATIENVKQTNGAKLLSCYNATGECHLNSSTMTINDIMNTSESLIGGMREITINNAESCKLYVNNCSSSIENQEALHVAVYCSYTTYDNYKLISDSDQIIFLLGQAGNGKIFNSYIENGRVDLYDSAIIEINNSSLANNLMDKPNMSLTGNAEGTLYLSNVTLQGYSSNFAPHVIIKEK